MSIRVCKYIPVAVAYMSFDTLHTRKPQWKTSCQLQHNDHTKHLFQSKHATKFGQNCIKWNLISINKRQRFCWGEVKSLQAQTVCDLYQSAYHWRKFKIGGGIKKIIPEKSHEWTYLLLFILFFGSYWANEGNLWK